MLYNIHQVGPEAIQSYASVPIAFEVRSRYRVDLLEGGLGGMRLVEEPVDPPYLKDYDVDELPTDWLEKFDVRNWAFFLAFAAGSSGSDHPVGAATVVFDTPAVNMLDSRRDLTVLWDIRVRPGFRGQGIGTRLFQTALDWSRAQGCTQMKIETQNINVNACRFYASQGCQLGCIHRYAYCSTPYAHEAMLFWYKDL